jgi:hypothetical protein
MQGQCEVSGISALAVWKFLHVTLENYPAYFGTEQKRDLCDR